MISIESLTRKQKPYTILWAVAQHLKICLNRKCFLFDYDVLKYAKKSRYPLPWTTFKSEKTDWSKSLLFDLWSSLSYSLNYRNKTTSEWHKYEPSPILENENFNILWDFSTQTDKEIRVNRPDIVFVGKREQTVLFIDVTTPNDHNIIEKRLEKIEKYTDFRILGLQWRHQKVKLTIFFTIVLDNVKYPVLKDLCKFHTDIP